MDEIKVRKLIGKLLRVVLNHPEPHKLPEDVRKIRNEIIRAAEDPLEAAKRKEAIEAVTQELIQEAGTGAIDTTPVRPPPSPEDGEGPLEEP